MAGFFGTFNYEKEGPGVDKNAPQKKSFIAFWELFFRKFWKLIEVNLIYLLTCIPVVTIGLGNAGMTFLTRNFSREKPVFVVSDYVDIIRKNWKQALPVGVINTALTLLLAYDIVFFFESYIQGGDITQLIFLGLVFGIYTIFTIMKYYVYMMLITFRLTLKQLYKNALLMVSAGMKSNLIISGVLLVLYALMIVPVFYSWSFLVVDLVLFLLIVPAFRSLLIQFYVFPVIKKHMIEPYYREHPEEKKQAARILNVFFDEDEDEAEKKKQEEEAPVFKDTGKVSDEGNDSRSSFTIPHQYSEQELRGHGRKRIENQADDDDVI